MNDMSCVRALAFDYYGTIANKQALAATVDEHFPGKGTHFTKRWLSMLQRYCFQNGMMERYTPRDELTKAAFKLAAAECGIDASDTVCDELIVANESLTAYEEANEVPPTFMGSWPKVRSQHFRIFHLCPSLPTA